MRTSLLVACMLTLFGCGSPTEVTSAPTKSSPGSNLDDVWTLVTGPSQPAATTPQNAESDHGIPGEDETAIRKSLLSGCSYIQWCDEPGPVGSVCIWTACSLAAARAECTDDANSICGKITPPSVLRRK